MSTSPRLMLVELNEFAPDYLSEMARAMALPHLRRILSYPHTHTATADEVEHQGLDPWVQWVGVHCGKPTSEHGVRRHGATRVQTSAQIWHAVAQQGHSWGVWGVMNAPLGDKQGCKFFMPDPWSFDEQAFPPALNDVLALPRYVAKNYLDIDYGKAFLSALQLARFFAPVGHWALLGRFGTQCLKATLKTGPNVHTFTTLLDYLSVLCFVRLRRQHAPNLSIIFLNHIAHLQHQFWTLGTQPHPEMKLGLELSNAMMGLLLADRRPGEGFLLMNGLKQQNVAGKGFHVYRQRNPQGAIEQMGIKDGRVEQCMTHDANILFANSNDADQALAILERCMLSDGHKVFYVERNNPLSVFYQLAFEHKVQPQTAIISGNYSQPFDAVFQLVCERTGAHVPEGDVFADGIEIPDHIQNHEVFGLVEDFFRRTNCASTGMLAAE